MRRAGVTVRPIRQLTGTSEFSEVSSTGPAPTPTWCLAARLGWRVARFLLGVERGAATFGRQLRFRQELEGLIADAKRTGAAADPMLRERIARAWVGLEVLRAYALDIGPLGNRPAGPHG